METYPIPPRESGKLPFAFEIDNLYIAPRAIAQLLDGIKGVTDVEMGGKPDVRVSFCHRGRPYLVWEPWGDNSRYWIGPDDEHSRADISTLEGAFRSYRPPLHRRLIGDILSLKFITRLFHRSTAPRHE